MKTLIWKELKEIQKMWLGLVGVWLAGHLIWIIFGNYTITALSNYLCFAYLLIIGSRAFGSEYDNRTIDYLKTRPFSPFQILLSKYLAGLLQITSFLVVPLITYQLNRHTASFINTGAFYPVIHFLYGFLFLASLFTLSFFISVIFRDTGRSFLIAFTLVLIYWAKKLYLDYQPIQYHTPITYQMISLTQTIFTYLIFIVFLLGLSGIIYYSVYKRRFVWKTGFWACFPLGLLLMNFSQQLTNDTIKPLNYMENVRLSDDKFYSAPDKTTLNRTSEEELNYWDKQVYGLEYSSKSSLVRLMKVDVQNPNHLTLQPVPKIPSNTYHVKYDGNKIYFLNDHYINSSKIVYELVVSELDANNNIYETHRIPISKGPVEIYSHVEDPIILKPDSIFVFYGIQTGLLHIDAHGISTSISKGPSFGVRALVKKHLVQIDKKTWQIKDQFDLDSTTNIDPFVYGEVAGKYSYYPTEVGISIYDVTDWKSPKYVNRIDFSDTSSISFNYMFYPYKKYDSSGTYSLRIQGNYLYSISPDYPLVIYDITNPQNPKLVGNTNWDWVEKLALQEKSYQPNLYSQWNNYLMVSGNRAIVFFYRGFLVYDISNPAHPLQIAKMDSDRVLAATRDKDNLYLTEDMKGFSIYRIP